MAAQSLSPLPEMVTVMIRSLSMSGAIFMAWAMAWADSIAGMIPCFLIRYGHIFRPAHIMQMSVLRTNARVVEPCRNRINGCDLAVLILTEVGLHSVENARFSCGDGGRRLLGVNASACRLASDKSDALIFNEVPEAADGVRPAANAGDNHVRKPALLLHKLPSDLL